MLGGTLDQLMFCRAATSFRVINQDQVRDTLYLELADPIVPVELISPCGGKFFIEVITSGEMDLLGKVIFRDGDIVDGILKLVSE